MFNHKVSHLTVLDGRFLLLHHATQKFASPICPRLEFASGSENGERSDPSCNREVGGNATHIPVTGYLQAISH